MKKAIDTIRQQIKHNVEQSHAIRRGIHQAKGRERHNLWNEKRAVGEGTRYLLLALACLRGRSYDRIEPVGSSVPHARGILSEIRAALGKDSPEAAGWTEDRIKAWLVRPEATMAPSVVSEVAA